MPGTMLRNIKLMVGTLVGGIVVGSLMLVFGINGPLYRSTVVSLPINLQSPSEQETTFTVDRTEEYMVEIHLKSVFPDEKMDMILGDYVAGGGGAIEVSWTVKTNDSVVAQGSNKEYGYSPIMGGGHSGLAIGTVSAEKGKEYHLSVSTKNVSADWNKVAPYVEVGLHPAKLESYIVLQLFGALITTLFAVILIVVAALHFISKSRSASNMASRPTAKNASA
jgi:hypothetical protein